MNKYPDSPGIWEWFEEDGTKRLVNVVNTSCVVDKPIFEVTWNGSYYNIEEYFDNIYNLDGSVFETNVLVKSEWTDGRWGNFVAKYGELPEDSIYLYRKS